MIGVRRSEKVMSDGVSGTHCTETEKLYFR